MPDRYGEQIFNLVFPLIGREREYSDVVQILYCLNSVDLSEQHSERWGNALFDFLFISELMIIYINIISD